MDEMMMRDETAEKVLEAVEAQRKATTTRTSSRFTASRGGHAPGHLREAFESWVEDGATAETVAVGSEEAVRPIAWLLGQLWNCSDTMPSGLCEQLDMRSGSTFAQGVREYARSRAVYAARDERNQDRPFSLETDLRALEGLITEVDADLIIIDPLSAYLGKVDSHNDAELRRVLGPLAALAERMHVAILCVMHLTKDAQRRALYRAQGSVAFVAAARSVLAVVEDKDIPDRRLFVAIKSNLGPRAAALAFTHDNERLRWEDRPVADVDVEALFQPPKPDQAPARRAAEQFLHEALKNGPRPQQELEAAADANGISVSTLRRAKISLKVEAGFRGVVGKTGAWEWRLPKPQGKGK